VIAKVLKDVGSHALGIQLLVAQTQDSIVADRARLDLIAHGFDDVVSAMRAIEDGCDVTSQIR
jgi:hypothetical protein